MPQKKLSQKLSDLNKIVFSIVFVLVLFYLLVVSDNYFAVRKIEVMGIGDSSLIRGVSNYNSKNILLLNADEVQKHILSRNPHFNQVNVSKKYPGTLLIVVSFRTPYANFAVDKGFFILSDDGKIIKKSQSPVKDLPIIKYYQKFNFSSWQSGDNIQYKDIATSIKFLKDALDLGLAIDTIDIKGTNMIALRVKEKSILFTTEKDEKIQGYQFKTIVKKLKIEGRDFTVLDVRFDKPVIQFK